MIEHVNGRALQIEVGVRLAICWSYSWGSGCRKVGPSATLQHHPSQLPWATMRRILYSSLKRHLHVYD